MSRGMESSSGRETRLDSRTDASPASTGGNLVIVDPNALSLLATAGAMHSSGHHCVCARNHLAALDALSMDVQDAMVIDVGDDAAAALELVSQARQVDGYQHLPVVLIADAAWAGLEIKAEAMPVATRCLFKPIDPHSLLAVVDRLLWMPTLVRHHRSKGSRPIQNGWVTL